MDRLQFANVSNRSWLCKKSAARKIDGTDFSSERIWGNGNFSARSILIDLRKPFPSFLSLGSFYTARVVNGLAASQTFAAVEAKTCQVELFVDKNVYQAGAQGRQLGQSVRSPLSDVSH